MTDRGRFNQHGGLTLVPMPEFEGQARYIKERIENKTRKAGSLTTVDIAIPRFDTRASGEPFCQFGKEHVGGHDCVVLTSGPCTYEKMMQLLLALGYLKGRHASRVTVVMGYFFLGRSDKDEDPKNELALPGFIARLLESAAQGKLERIISADLHAPQIVMAGLMGDITEIHLGRLILGQAVKEARAKSRKICLAFPDDGAAKRDESAVERIIVELGLTGFPIVFGAKRRKSSKEASIRRLFGDLEEVPESIVLSVDDEIATCKTTLDYARELKRAHGAGEVWALATHAVFCGPAADLLADPTCPVDRVFVTDTIPLDNRPELAALIASDKITVVSWLDALAAIILCHHKDEDIRRIV